MGDIEFQLQLLMAKKKIKSITQLAELTGLSRPTLSRIYNNETKRIDANTTYVLCKFFECEIGDLIKLVDKKDETTENN
ncbi:helix-turn-helix domain-containing protein [Bacillus badius]|uniref:HTH cro/C1-type domain-containing protein n=1 Tax=Bacillus badius TaxID=1455 RepID=A0ABR5AXV6_BACBA|nr:helix-turn-helix transcriptional regulator [Bacillus badius]KIL79543.1 hypothetical protein SD77_1997 [Bacillus badius]MED4718627.1 helix-turn-helix transcriptional regulator [Bacillus badius]